MGIYDSMARTMGVPGGQPMNKNPNSMGQGFAQQKPPAVGNSFGAKQQMRANPMMQNRPAMGQGFQNAGNQLMQAYQNRGQGQQPNPINMMQNVQPGMMGSNSQITQKQLAAKNQQAAQQGGAIGGSYNQLLSAHPQLANYRDTGMKAGQDMSWMDKPGALSMGPPAPEQEQRPQYGLQDVASRYAQEQQPVASPMQAAVEQMRGPDMGSQDPRELARVGQMGPLQGQVGLQNAPFEGNQPGSNGFQTMLENMGGARPDVMPRGLGPSMGQTFGQPMDENGLEARRGPR